MVTFTYLGAIKSSSDSNLLSAKNNLLNALSKFTHSTEYFSFSRKTSSVKLSP